jgi:diacylglycerol O-acyltransferase
MQRLSALDSGFLALETESQPLHVGALLVLDGPAPDPDAARSELLARVERWPDCRRRPHLPRHRWRRPVWEFDPAADPRRHVRSSHVGGLGDRDALRAHVMTLMKRPLDRARPLWEVWHLDGLRDGSWAVLLTAHHAMVDGASGAGMLASLLAPQDPSAGGPSSIGRPEPAARGGWSRLRQGVRTVAVPDLPANALNGPLGDERSWDWATLDLAAMMRVAHERGCTLNDVYLALLSAALRRSGVLRASADARVRAIVPTGMRTGSSRVGLGNLDAAMFVELPVGLDSVSAMLSDVAVQSARSKAEQVPLATDALVRASAAVPAPLLDRLARVYARRGQSRVNLAASNVRGPGSSLNLCGRPVREIVPCLPLALHVRVTSALLSYAGLVSVSVTADRAAVSDAEVLTCALIESWAELASA